MDIPGRLGGLSKSCNTRDTGDTELGEMKVVAGVVPVVEDVPCHSGACKSAVTKIWPDHRLESPWHYLKTLFLISMIVALVVWILIYVLLSQYELL
ncbi:PREDICTED: uncharacterized protein LOC105362935 isoform X2 [Ceratosolen solmsi marchali]|nr:PREDICTED: uncharacterized protein LOC105362935 isoform X2 [Ceratosolen solmsi marchali]XP_011498787.1 PREDICTED: uncharacterized protein LOC105362935 isoform X2 [Ceratosolen solmsi marchali]